MFDRTLLPSDGSKGSLRAAAVVADLAKRNPNASVTAICIVGQIDPRRTDIDETIVEHQNNAVRRHAEDALALTAKVFAEAGVAFESRIVVGDPVSTAVVAFVKSGGFDVVAMASRGLTMKRGDRHYLGSVTDHVVRQVDIPVLVLPIREEV